VPLASKWSLSSDTALAAAATDFLAFVQPLMATPGPVEREKKRDVGHASSRAQIFSTVDVEKYLNDPWAPRSAVDELSETAEFLVLEAAQEDSESVDFFGGPPAVDDANYLQKLDYLAGQREAIEYFEEQLTSKPVAVAGQCHELWQKLVDLILSDNVEIAEASIALAGKLFDCFSQQLSPSGSLVIVPAFNFLSGCDGGIAERADHLLGIIAKKAHRSHVFQSFIAGARHKTAIARGKAASCLGMLIRQSRLDDREFSVVLKSLAPLLRDSRGETKAAARTVLGGLAVDQRFESLSVTAVTNPQDFRELMALVE
jgi:hypothetical protein